MNWELAWDDTLKIVGSVTDYLDEALENTCWKGFYVSFNYPPGIYLNFEIKFEHWGRRSNIDDGAIENISDEEMIVLGDVLAGVAEMGLRIRRTSPASGTVRYVARLDYNLEKYQTHTNSLL